MKNRRGYVIIILSLLGIALFGCGSPYRIDSIQVTDFFTDTMLTIPLSSPNGLGNGGQSTNIITNDSSEKMSQKLQAVKMDPLSLIVKEYANGSLLVSVMSNEKTCNIFSVVKRQMRRDSAHDFAYQFCDSSAYLDETGYTVIWPFHLLKESNVYSSYEFIRLNGEYFTDYSIQDFLEFYVSLGNCYSLSDKSEIHIDNNKLIIPASFLKLEYEIPQEKKIKSYFFDFQLENEQPYVTIGVNYQ